MLTVELLMVTVELPTVTQPLETGRPRHWSRRRHWRCSPGPIWSIVSSSRPVIAPSGSQCVQLEPNRPQFDEPWIHLVHVAQTAPGGGQVSGLSQKRCAARTSGSSETQLRGPRQV